MIERWKDGESGEWSTDRFFLSQDYNLSARWRHPVRAVGSDKAPLGYSEVAFSRTGPLKVA
jgi:hypothetical protein